MDFISYLFVSPGAEFNYYLPIVVFAALMIGIGLFIKLWSRKDKACRRVFKNSTGNFLTLGSITLILLGARYEEVPFISMRFLLGLSILVSFYAILKSILKYRKNYSSYKAQIESQKNTPNKKVYSHSKKKNK